MKLILFNRILHAIRVLEMYIGVRYKSVSLGKIFIHRYVGIYIYIYIYIDIYIYIYIYISIYIIYIYIYIDLEESGLGGGFWTDLVTFGMMVHVHALYILILFQIIILNSFQVINFFVFQHR